MFSQNRLTDAVSPVVGVILMVAVTVILAAVIGSFVLDMGSNVEQNPSAGVTFDQDADSVSAQVISAESVDKLELKQGDSSIDTLEGDDLTPGASLEASAGDLDSYPDGTVSLVGTLNGNEAVLQSYDYEGIEDPA